VDRASLLQQRPYSRGAQSQNGVGANAANSAAGLRMLAAFSVVNCGAVETVMLFKDPFVVGLPREHLLAKETRVKPERLWREDLLCISQNLI
jgi:hypothetical protein